MYELEEKENFNFNPKFYLINIDNYAPTSD